MVQRKIIHKFPKISSVSGLMMGCDPEFFFSDLGGKIVGSEKVIPKGGISVHGGKIVMDGVQCELNPSPSSCRAILGNNIIGCFREVGRHIAKTGATKIDFSSNIEITKEELDSLSNDSKRFGCAPSINVYKKKPSRIRLNGATFTKRSAGGHIHLGGDQELKPILQDVKVMVPLLDLIVGNTCVLLDTDKANADRRRYYGKAGEIRLPSHGLEYRTLSNFWLKSYQTMSMVMGLSRLAVSIAVMSKQKRGLLMARSLLKTVKRSDIIKAINKNDVNLAKENFDKMIVVLEKMLPSSVHEGGRYDLSLARDNIHLFRHFVSKGLDYWFPSDPYENWTVMGESIGGFENFLEANVLNDYVADHRKDMVEADSKQLSAIKQGQDWESKWRLGIDFARREQITHD